MSDFSQQTAVITGGAQGIGGAVADTLRAGGARIVIWDMDAELAAEKAASLGSDCFALPVNVADWRTVEAARDETLAKSGRIDIVVNNAGILRDQIFHRMTAEEWDAVEGQSYRPPGN